MKCNTCQSENLKLIMIFAGHNAVGWSPVGAEKDIFGNYKKLRPLAAHACGDCGNVNWNIKVDKEQDSRETIQALGELADEETDAAEESAAYTFGEEDLN